MRIGAFELPEPVPTLREPHALTMIRPWVDVGNVGTLTLQRLERHFRAQPLGQLARPGTFFDFTRYRPTTRLVNGQREVTSPNTVVKYAQPAEGPGLPCAVKPRLNCASAIPFKAGAMSTITQ